MPLSDLADYDGDYYLKNARLALLARDTFPWGKNLPEDIFRQFVLPIRVNNENLDGSREVFFAELKERLKGLSMKEAALEVNHWAHEKVTYRGTDVRTSCPLATVKTAFGRCGEETTFVVAALRAAAIPARQVYVPRWAHCDDNHAWVEIWVDGNWRFFGACEPEPDLDLAWFNEPSKRAMLVSTTVLGEYRGSEDILESNPRYTKINNLRRYAPTRRISAKVIDGAGRAVSGARLEFQIYNDGEFFPLAKCTTGKEGACSFLTGLGDLLVWAARDNRFGFRKISVKSSAAVTITLEKKPDKEYQLNLDLIPPKEIKSISARAMRSKPRTKSGLPTKTI